jgi:hypothetical protein
VIPVNAATLYILLGVLAACLGVLGYLAAEFVRYRKGARSRRTEATAQSPGPSPSVQQPSVVSSMEPPVAEAVRQAEPSAPERAAAVAEPRVEAAQVQAPEPETPVEQAAAVEPEPEVAQPAVREPELSVVHRAVPEAEPELVAPAVGEPSPPPEVPVAAEPESEVAEPPVAEREMQAEQVEVTESEPDSESADSREPAAEVASSTEASPHGLVTEQPEPPSAESQGMMMPEAVPVPPPPPALELAFESAEAAPVDVALSIESDQPALIETPPPAPAAELTEKPAVAPESASSVTEPRASGGLPSVGQVLSAPAFSAPEAPVEPPVSGDEQADGALSETQHTTASSHEVPQYTLVAPVELHFTEGGGRLGVRPGTRTHAEFKRLADLLLADLREALQ